MEVRYLTPKITNFTSQPKFKPWLLMYPNHFIMSYQIQTNVILQDGQWHFMFLVQQELFGVFFSTFLYSAILKVIQGVYNLKDFNDKLLSIFRIDKVEFEYLTSDQKQTKEEKTPGSSLKVPWCKMLRSRAVHVLWFTHFCSAFGFYLLNINLTLFIREALGFQVINVNDILLLFSIIRILAPPCIYVLWNS